MLEKLTVQRVSCLVLAATYLSRARLTVAISNPSTLAILLTQSKNGFSLNSTSVVTVSRGWLRDLAWAINGLSRRLPYRADCLVRVLAAQYILNDRAPFEVHVSAGHKDGRFLAHTWIICQGIEITGGAIAGLERLEHEAPKT